MSIVMVIGCNGLIGSSHVRKLLNEGHDVVGYSRRNPDVEHSRFHSYTGELSELNLMISIMLRHHV